MLRCIEQEVFNISYKHPNQKIKVNDWYTKKHQPMWMVADFECMNVPVDENRVDSSADSMTQAGFSNKKLFINKPVARGFNIVKKEYHDNLNFEKNGYNKYFED